MGAQFIKSSADKIIYYDTLVTIGGSNYYSRTRKGTTTRWNEAGEVSNLKVIAVSSSDTSKGTVSGDTTFGYVKSDSAQTVTITSTCTPVGENEFLGYTTNVGTIEGNVITIPANTDVDINVSAVFGVIVKLPIGGRIFYVDETATGATYTFYDASGNILPTQTVAGLANATQYSVEGTPSKDKFYVADSTNGMKKYDGTNYVVWATASEDLSAYSSVFDVLETEQTTVGTGRRNTNWINTNRNNSTYFPNGASNNYSIWDFAKYCNDNSINGCSDWFVPSLGEVTQLRQSGIWGSSIAEWVNTTKYGSNNVSYLWSSSAYSTSFIAWYWYAYSDNDDGLDYNRERSLQDDSLLGCVVRAF